MGKRIQKAPSEDLEVHELAEGNLSAYDGNDKLASSKRNHEHTSRRMKFAVKSEWTTTSPEPLQVGPRSVHRQRAIARRQVNAKANAGKRIQKAPSEDLEVHELAEGN